MAREVTLGVQSTLHRAHLPIPSRGLPAPSSAGLLGSCKLGAGPLPAPHGQGPSAVRRSGGISVPSKELRNSFRHLHWHERILPFLNPAVPRAHAVVRLLCPYTYRICWSVESQTEAQGHSAQHQGPQIQHDDLNPALT